MSLISDIREQLDEVAGGIFWHEDHLHDAVNSAIVEVFAATKHEHGTATLTFTASNDTVSLGTTIMLPQYLIGTATEKIFPTTIAKLEAYNRSWRNHEAAYPKHFVVVDTEHIAGWPTPDAAYTMVLHGVPWPSCGEITEGVEEITVPSTLRLAVVKRAAANLLEYTQPQLADGLILEALEAEHDFIVQLRNRQSHNIRRLRPGTTYTRAQAGSVGLGRRIV
jgi:hypothetical protein